MNFVFICTLRRKHELRKRQNKFLQNANTLQVKNFTLKVLSEVVFIDSIDHIKSIVLILHCR